MAFNFFGAPDMSSIHQEIRQLCAKHGYRAVHEGLQFVMQEDYRVLKSIFEGVPEPTPFTHHTVFVSDTIDTPFASFDAAIQQPQQQEKKQKKQVKKANKELQQKKEKEPENKPEFAPPAETFPEDMLDNLVDSTKLGTIKPGTEIVVSKLGNQEEPEVKPTFFTSADERAWQKEEEAKTKHKLDATGITPESLLTKENLEQWVQKEKKGYAYIARRHVGLPEPMIAAKCKEFGIVSEAAKRRQAIVAARANAARGRGRGR